MISCDWSSAPGEEAWSAELVMSEGMVGFSGEKDRTLQGEGEDEMLSRRGDDE